MNGLPCDAAEFLHARGPSPVPFRLCCVAAVIQARNTPTPEAPPLCIAALLASAASEAGSAVVGASGGPR